MQTGEELINKAQHAVDLHWCHTGWPKLTMAISATAVNKTPILSRRVYVQLWDSYVYQSPDGQGTEGDSAVPIQLLRARLLRLPERV